MSEAALAGNQASTMALINALSSSGSTAGAGAGSGALAEMLLQQYGEENVTASINNIAAKMVSDVVNELIDSLQMPDFMADQAKQAVTDATGEATTETPNGLDEQVSEAVGENASEEGGAAEGSESESDVGAIMKQSMMDELENASGDSGGRTNNWLAQLARAMGKVAGEHLDAMVTSGKKMGELDSKESPEAFAEEQANMQAEAQMLKMYSEGLKTAVASTGEALSSIARKQ